MIYIKNTEKFDRIENLTLLVIRIKLLKKNNKKWVQIKNQIKFQKLKEIKN